MAMRAVSALLTLSLLLFTSWADAGSNEAGIKYLEENKNKPGVVTLPSGLQYRVLEKGSGAFHPTVNSPCLCHYHGTLVDGTIFDSSMDRGEPITFAPNQVIRGWTEAMSMMVEGDLWELTIPSELAYGDRGSPPKINGGDTLVFKIQMIEIKGDKTAALRCNPHTGVECNDKEVAYATKQMPKGATAWEKERDRLVNMKQKKMAPDLKEWLERRLHILSELLTGDSGHDDEL